MRLIDSDWLRAQWDEPTDWKDGDQVLHHYTWYKTMIDVAPTVDAVPVVHGWWKEDPSGYGFWICSACGFVSEASAANMLYKFCPVCGAKMDGKDGDVDGV